MLPNFLIVGAAKAGTTSLFYYLQQHPEITFPDLKEPKYFSSINLRFPHRGIGDSVVDKFAIKELSDYKRIFYDCSTKRIGEASPDYLYYYQKTPGEIKKVLGDVPIIIILRDPVRRAFSAYSYLVRDSRERLQFRDALDIEESRIKNNYDFIWAYKKGGLYHDQVKAYIEVFSDVKVLLLEDFIVNKDCEIKSIFDFLNVDTKFKVDFSIVHNPSGKPSNCLVKLLLSRNNMFSQSFREVMKRYINRGLLEKYSSYFLIKEKIKTEDELYLRKYFQNDIFRLEELLNIDLSDWKL